MWTEMIDKQLTELRKSLKMVSSYLIWLHKKELNDLNILIDTD